MDGIEISNFLFDWANLIGNKHSYRIEADDECLNKAMNWVDTSKD
jgi:hypothetical protein